MYKETKPPCYGCTKRHVGCHAKCSGYLDWNEERQQRMKEHQKTLEVERNLRDAEIKRHIKIKQSRKNKRSFGR